MSWLRLYDEVVDDPKVQQLPLLLFRAWINCLCIAKKNGGSLPEMRDVAYRLHVTETRAEALVKELVTAELFELDGSGSFTPHNWHGRQFQSDVSTDRVKRFRNAQRNVSETKNETGDETDQRQIQKQSTETETEQTQKQKRPYGQFVNVLLSDEEFQKLEMKFGVDGLSPGIESLSEYIASKGVKYKSHYATILAWYRRKSAEGKYGNTKPTAAAANTRAAQDFVRRELAKTVCLDFPDVRQDT